MRVVRNLWSQLHRFVLWAILSTVLWAWIFTLVTDTTPARKVTLYVWTEECREQELTEALEETKPDGIRMIKVHPFPYALFDSQDMLNADLFVVPGSQLQDFTEAFAPIDPAALDTGDWELFRIDGQAYGVKIYDAASDRGAAMRYLGYWPGEDHYLFFNLSSLHLGGEGDGAALRVAEALLRLP